MTVAGASSSLGVVPHCSIALQWIRCKHFFAVAWMYTSVCLSVRPYFERDETFSLFASSEFVFPKPLICQLVLQAHTHSLRLTPLVSLRITFLASPTSSYRRSSTRSRRRSCTGSLSARLSPLCNSWPKCLFFKNKHTPSLASSINAKKVMLSYEVYHRVRDHPLPVFLWIHWPMFCKESALLLKRSEISVRQPEINEL